MFSTLLRDIRSHALNNIEYFQNGTTSSAILFHKGFSLLHEHLDRGIQPSIEEITPRLHEFDLSPDIQANGYRSLIKVVHKCCQHILQLARHITNSRTSMFFRGHHYSKELEAYVSVLGQLRASLHFANKLIPYCDSGNLFANENNLDNEVAENLLKEVEMLSQDCFYGRCLGFQFCDSMVKPLVGVAVAMASFSDGYKNASQLLQLTSSLFNSGKYILDPDLRAQRVVDVTRTADISFCKAFWSITESDVMQLSHLACPMLHVNEVITLKPGVFEMSCVNSVETVMITPPCAFTGPGEIKMRLFSNHWRSGQVVPETKKQKKPHPVSSGLVLHCHGGGFVAQSSRSHEVYLRQWARVLDVPILSIDYSLAPEFPFPRALEECFYAYAWALNNKEKLGWTGEKICFAGDSAGGNLMMATALRAAAFRIRVPDGIMAAYTPFMVRYTPSPSRMMGLMDPLLPMGILTRCLAAYAGVSTSFSPKDDKWVFVEYKKEEGDNSRTNSEGETIEKSNIESSEKDSYTSSDTCFEDVDMEANGVKHDDEFEVLSVTKDAVGTPDSNSSQFSIEDYDVPEPEDVDKISKDSAHESVQLDDDDLTKDLQDSAIKSEFVNSDNSDTLSELTDNSKQHKKLERLSKGISGLSTSELPQEMCQAKTPTKSKPKVLSYTIGKQNSISDTSDSGLETSLSHSDGLNFVPLRAAKQHILHSPLTAFRHLPIVKNPYMSPMLASDDLVKDLPPVYLVACHLDPLLDDSVMFAKKLRNLNKQVDLHLIDDLPHGFLNFSMVSKEARLASDICISKIMSVLG